VPRIEGSVSHLDLVAAGRALAELGPEANVRAVRVNGKTVTDLAAARAALAEETKPLPAEKPGWVARMAARLSRRVDDLGDRMEKKGKVGARVNALLDADPEKVTVQAHVEIDLFDGSTRPFDLSLVDRKLSARLQRTSAALALAGMLPLFVGSALTALTAGLAAVGSRIAEYFGRAGLARALKGMTSKFLGLLGLSFIPGVSTAAKSMSAVMDYHDAKEASRAPSVASIVDLGNSPAKPT
jgi:hypothetical protein